MDLTFQVLMQYCSLQHQTLLPSPVTSTTGCCFCFGFISSFFLELFLHCSSVAYWAPTDLESSSFSAYLSRWQSRRTCTHLLLWELQNYNSLLNNHQQENVESHQKKDFHVQGQRRSPSKMVGGVKSHLESNPIPSQRHSEGSNKMLCIPGDAAETEPDLPLNIWVSPAEVRVSSGLPQGQGL